MGGPGSKRMSLEEKRKVVLEIYHKSKSVYTEKEILALAAKAGVNANTVGDIHTGLVEDGLVDKEKIGGSNYFWSFPSKQDRQAQLNHQVVLQEIEQLKQELENVQQELASARRGREDDDEDDDGNEEDDGIDEENNEEPKTKTPDANEGTTTEDTNNATNPDPSAPPVPKKRKTKENGNGGRRYQKLARLATLAKEKTDLQAELESLKENDPQALADLQQEFTYVQQAANRWTDNIFNCQTYLVKKRGMNKKDVNKMLGITDSFDYPEDKVPKA